MNDLAGLGFLGNSIVETIVSTYNSKGQPNAAPMGVKTEETKHMIIRPYTSTLTYTNLQLKRCAVINVTSNPELYYRTAFKNVNPEGRIPLQWFEKGETVDAPRLRIAEAFVEVSVVNIKYLDPERAEVLCDVKLIKASSLLPKAYCRATFATIEAVIHATRVKLLLAGDKQEEEQAHRLIELIEHYNAVVNRIAPNSSYSVIMADLTQRINSWKVKS
jgi:hypothetical protein